MSRQIGTDNPRKKFLDIPTAAQVAGFSSRHFRKIIEEDRIPVQQIGTKMFVEMEDLETWKSTRGETRLQAALQSVEEWLREEAARARRLQQEQEEAKMNFIGAVATGY